jgi:hypothetical protein
MNTNCKGLPFRSTVFPILKLTRRTCTFIRCELHVESKEVGNIEGVEGKSCTVCSFHRLPEAITYPLK